MLMVRKVRRGGLKAPPFLVSATWPFYFGTKPVSKKQKIRPDELIVKYIIAFMAAEIMTCRNNDDQMTTTYVSFL